MKKSKGVEDVLTMLHEWDNTNRDRRKNICNDFIKTCGGKTAPDLEASLAQGGSLLLARLAAYLRISYMHNPYVPEVLNAIGVFLKAAGGGEFAREFVEVGGILTLIEIISLRQAPETHKATALHLLNVLANAGRNYKEQICDAYGVRATAECLAQATEEETQENSQVLLATLGDGNAKYTEQVYSALVALLGSENSRAQHLAAASLREIQSRVGTLHSSLIQATLNLLASPSLDVQTEALYLVKMIVERPEARPALLSGLVDLLTPAAQMSSKITQTSIIVPARPCDIQQAAASEVIRVLAEEGNEFCEMFLQLNVVRGLLVAMGNMAHPDAQRRSAETLSFFTQMFPSVDEDVREAMGIAVYDLFKSDPEGLYKRITAIQADALVHNQVKQKLSYK